VIVNKDEEKAQQALSELEADDSDESWELLAKELSEDQASKDRGGLLEGVVEGQSDPTFEEEVFAAPEGELVGPFETERGFYVIQVESATEAEATPLAEVSDQIRQQLVATRQQEVAQEFQTDFIAKWTDRTVCADGYVIVRCSNAPPPASPEGAPPVQANRPLAPGSAGAIGATTSGLPQGPIPPPAPEAESGLPPGVESLGGAGASPPGATTEGPGAQQGAP